MQMPADAESGHSLGVAFVVFSSEAAAAAAIRRANGHQFDASHTLVAMAGKGTNMAAVGFGDAFLRSCSASERLLEAAHAGSKAHAVGASRGLDAAPPPPPLPRTKPLPVAAASKQRRPLRRSVKEMDALVQSQATRISALENRLRDAGLPRA